MISLSVSTEWIEMQGEGEECSLCEHEIWGVKHEMYCFFGGSYIPDKIMTVCAGCNEEIKNR